MIPYLFPRFGKPEKQNSINLKKKSCLRYFTKSDGSAKQKLVHLLWSTLWSVV